ncbi:HNH endonuclease signature motif containing protein [Escherichia coli]
MDKVINWHDYFTYKLGRLYWKVKPKHGGVCIGDAAGCVCSTTSYRLIRYKQKQYLEHRIIWEMHNGPIPEGYEIDHIDHNTLNNDITNLRMVSHYENTLNTPMRKDNKSGYVGVIWYKSRRKWMAYIAVNKKRKHLGLFDSIDEAVAARRQAEKENNYHPNHGSV